MKTSARQLLQFFCVSLGLFELVQTANWHRASDGRDYLIEQSANYNWLQALDQCTRQGLQLVVIDSPSKNNALVALLRSIFGKSLDLWIGHHDEFYKKSNKNRPWYSATSGQPISFSYWASGEPNNKFGEHCAQIYRKADFKWNDEDCVSRSFGFICEEHHFNAQCRSSIEAKRQYTNQKNSQLSEEFSKTQSSVKEIGEKTRLNTDNLLQQLEKSSIDVLENFKKSLNDLILTRPYLQAVIGDVGEDIKKLVTAAKDDLAKNNQETRQLIEDVHLAGENSTNVVNSEFAFKLATNNNDIDKIIAY